DGPIYQAGTLSGNPIAMASGYHTLTQLTPETYADFQRKAEKLANGLSDVADEYGIPHTVNRTGSMLGFFFTDKDVINFETANDSNLEHFKIYFRTMINEGIFLPPSQFEGLFLSTAHSDEDLDKTIAAAERAFAEINRS